MTQTEFENKIEGLLNDYDEANIDRSKLFDGICDTIIELVKPKQEEISRLTTLSEQQTLDIVKREKIIAELKNDNLTAWNNSITPILEKNYCTLGTASHASSLLAREYVALKSKYDELVKGIRGLKIKEAQIVEKSHESLTISNREVYLKSDIQKLINGEKE